MEIKSEIKTKCCLCFGFEVMTKCFSIWKGTHKVYTLFASGICVLIFMSRAQDIALQIKILLYTLVQNRCQKVFNWGLDILKLDKNFTGL